MEITDVRIKRVDSPGKLKAYVSVTFDDCFVVHNLKVIAGQSGVFIAMPSRRTKTGEYKDIAHPISPAFRQKVQERILAAYDAGEGTVEGGADAQEGEEPS
jgi:stage V sporulation protein G